MKKLKFLLLLVLGIGMLPLAVQASSPPLRTGDVLFAESFNAFTDAEQQIHPGWTPWSDGDCEVEGLGNKCWAPDYRQANPGNAFPYRARGGDHDNAQQLFTTYATFHGGVFRKVPVTPGTIIEGRAWAMGWGSDDDDPLSYAEGQEMRMRIGIDPTGGTAPFANTVIWGGVHEHANNNQWHEVPAVRVTAENGEITIFLAAYPRWPTKHNDVYFDDVTLTYQGFTMPAEGAPAPVVPRNTGAAVAVVPDPVLTGLVSAEAPAVTGGASGLWLWLGGCGLVGLVGYTMKREGVR